MPAVIHRMKVHGHRIDRVILAGEASDRSLFKRVRSDGCAMGVEFDFRGGLSNADARRLMRACDCILFPSVSSIESLGRVILEAC